MICLLLPLLVVIFVILLSNLSPAESKIEDSFHKLCNASGCEHPLVMDPNLKVDVLYQGDFKFEPNQLSPVSTMTFFGKDILILNKNNGTIYRIENGTLLNASLLDANVANKRERGLLGITTSENNSSAKHFFLYYTESQKKDGTDICHVNFYCEPSSNPLGNRLYRYELSGDKLVNPKLLLDLPAAPAATHNGGVLKIGPDKNLYVVVGDLEGSVNESSSTKAQNFKNGSSPDGRAGILRITQDGKPVENGILSDKFPINLYYAYGIRNSFGIDFDPLTGNLWDTENGPEYGDEINLVKPGFNSGWNIVQGTWKPIVDKDPELDYVAGDELLYPKELVDFGGKGKYSPPEFIWNNTVGPTAIKFLNSDRLGKSYENDLFVACKNLGIIFHFDLNKARTALKLNGVLKDKVANSIDENRDITFSKGMGEITDIEVGPDGHMYVLSNYMNKPTIFRIGPR